jgi:hypothetical protein
MTFCNVRTVIFALLFISFNGNSNCGSWSKHTKGPIITTGLNFYASPSIHPPPELTGKIIVNSISWEINASSFPYDLIIDLCQVSNCIRLPGYRGSIKPLVNFSTKGEYSFRYTINKRREFRPAVFITANSLTINYCSR